MVLQLNQIKRINILDLLQYFTHKILKKTNLCYIKDRITSDYKALPDIGFPRRVKTEENKPHNNTTYSTSIRRTCLLLAGSH